MVPLKGIEPFTFRVSDECSTDELQWEMEAGKGFEPLAQAYEACELPAYSSPPKCDGEGICTLYENDSFANIMLSSPRIKGFEPKAVYHHAIIIAQVRSDSS